MRIPAILRNKVPAKKVITKKTRSSLSGGVANPNGQIPGLDLKITISPNSEKGGRRKRKKGEKGGGGGRKAGRQPEMAI